MFYDDKWVRIQYFKSRAKKKCYHWNSQWFTVSQMKLNFCETLYSSSKIASSFLTTTKSYWRVMHKYRSQWWTAAVFNLKRKWDYTSIDIYSLSEPEDKFSICHRNDVPPVVRGKSYKYCTKWTPASFWPLRWDVTFHLYVAPKYYAYYVLFTVYNLHTSVQVCTSFHGNSKQWLYSILYAA